MQPNYFRSLAFRAIAAACVAAAVSGAVNDSAGFIRISPSDVQWHDVPGGRGVQQATLLGDPSKPGVYVVRIKFPPHIVDNPHTHPNARYVTVLQGTWYTGTGDIFDFAQAVPLKAGSFMLHPAKAAHWDGSGGAETVIVQVIGEGPATATPVDSAKPFWIEAPH